MSHPSAFKTPEGEARYLAAYVAALRLWPVPYDEIDIPIRFGTTHVRMPPDTLRIPANQLSDDELRGMRVPTLLLMGDREVLCDAATAVARARGLIPDFEGELVPRCRHDMCFSQHRIVDARVLDFLKKTRLEDPHDSNPSHDAHVGDAVWASDPTMDEPLGHNAV